MAHCQENMESSTENVNVVSSEDLPRLIDEFCREVINCEGDPDLTKLGKVQLQLLPFLNHNHLQLTAKIQATVNYGKRNYEMSRIIIENGVFDESFHPFLQELYKKIWERKTGKKLRAYVFISFPLSIDSFEEDQTRKSVSKFLEDYYVSKRSDKKAMDIKSVAKMTGLSETFVEQRFKMYREARFRPRRQLNPVGKKKGISQNNNQNQIALNEYQNYCHYQYTLGSHTPDSNRFPLTRVPMTEPLTIEIPEDIPVYFPQF